MKKTIDQVEKIAMKLPFSIEWCEYKGETVVAQFNFERTRIAGKPMMDLSYCMTKALNYIVDQTVQWDKSKFKPSKLGLIKWGPLPELK